MSISVPAILSGISATFKNVCLSGGAIGADLQWGMMATRLQHNVIHWSFEDHRSSAPEEQVVVLSQEQLDRADQSISRANKTLGRIWPMQNLASNNLLRRNFYQIADTQALYAVTNMSRNQEISGGTAWAVQMYMDRFTSEEEPMENCKLYVFDQNSRVWWSWKNKWTMMHSEPPQPTGVWTGVGSRKLTFEGKWAIRKVMGGYEVGNQQINSIFPLIDNPVVGDTIYVPSLKTPGRGIDDFIGGHAKVQNVQKSGPDMTFVSVASAGGAYVRWEDIKDQQSTLREEFGMKPAHMKPDESFENNYLTESYRLRA